jgi:hypothetical protein
VYAVLIQRNAVVAGYRFTAIEHRRMFDRRGDDTRINPVPAAESLDSGIIAFRSATGEKYFRRLRVEQRGNLFTRGLDMAFDQPAEAVDTGWITVRILEKRKHRFQYFRSDTGGCVVVEIYRVRNDLLPLYIITD